MSVREFFSALPKVELNLQLTGAFIKDGLLMIARQNGIPAETDDYREWTQLLQKPDYHRIEELTATTRSWVRYPEDVARVIYDIGVSLSKQNINYAEIHVAPSDFMDSSTMGMDAFMQALNDGRDRALRGWGVGMGWVLCIPRENPRVGDDLVRWASSAAGREGNAVAIGLVGPEDAQPAGQFKRAFSTARKKAINTVAQAGQDLGIEGLQSALDELEPGRIIDPWGVHNDEELLTSLAQEGIPLVLSIHRALRLGLVKEAAQHPLRTLVDSGARIVLASGMPRIYKSSLVDEYVLAHEACGLSVDDVSAIARSSILCAFIHDEGKQALLDKFDKQLEFAKSSYLAT